MEDNFNFGGISLNMSDFSFFINMIYRKGRSDDTPAS